MERLIEILEETVDLKKGVAYEWMTPEALQEFQMNGISPRLPLDSDRYVLFPAVALNLHSQN